jgi:acetolactate decarboxylase
MIRSVFLLTLMVTACVVGCAPPQAKIPPDTKAHQNAIGAGDCLVQFSLLAALAANDYTGTATLREVLAAGDFGIGTFDRLDGEMIVLDGKIFQALANGTVRPANLAGTTPFAAVTFFAADGRIDGLSCAKLDDLDSQLDRKLPHRNSPYALCVTGQFESITIRSVAAQSPPFAPLVEVVKHQATWEHRNLRGTLVGLRCPQWMGTINVSGYHWHFLSDDHKIGGHLLACEFQNTTLEYDECTSVTIHIPQSAEFDQFDANSVSDEDVDKIERQRAPALK